MGAQKGPNIKETQYYCEYVFSLQRDSSTTVERRASSVEGRGSSVQWNAGSPSVEDSSTRSSLHVAWPDIVWTLCRSRPARTPWRSALGTRLLAVGRWQVNQTWRETIAVGYDVADS